MTPRYNFFDTRFRGAPMLCHGLCHRTHPASNFSTIFSVMMLYTSIAIRSLSGALFPAGAGRAWIGLKPISLPPISLHPDREGVGGTEPMRSAAEPPTSAAKHFKAAVTSLSGPDQGWRGGLERMPRKAGYRVCSIGRLLANSEASCRSEGAEALAAMCMQLYPFRIQ